MFSSLASFIFGSNTNCETNSDTTAAEVIQQDKTNLNIEETDNLIEVTSLTPSVAGNGERKQFAIKRGKNKHNNLRQQNKRKETKAPLPLKPKQSNNNYCDEEEFDEDDWFIVEKEGEEKHLSPTPTPTDSETENIPVVEVVKDAELEDAAGGKALTPQRRPLHPLNNRSRSQKQRNNTNKPRNNTKNLPGKGLSVSTLSPSRIVNDGCTRSGHEATADGGITRSLYLPPMVSQQNDEQVFITTIKKMEESWFVIPPPCFTSIGPISMETSPYENLLIEHPSMSVYYSIRKNQDAIEGFNKVDISEVDEYEKQTVDEKNSQEVQSRSSGSRYRLDPRLAQLKQELMTRNVQKVQIIKERSELCRNAIKRSNKVRDIQSKNHIARRSDRQHCRIFSNTNNNRKTNCY